MTLSKVKIVNLGLTPSWHHFNLSQAQTGNIHITLYEKPKQNLSLQYPYNIKQTSDENKQKYQLGDY